MRPAQRVLEALNRDYRNFSLFVNNHPWSRRFAEIGWDLTWVVLDVELRRLTILLATDAD